MTVNVALYGGERCPGQACLTGTFNAAFSSRSTTHHDRFRRDRAEQVWRAAWRRLIFEAWLQAASITLMSAVSSSGPVSGLRKCA